MGDIVLLGCAGHSRVVLNLLERGSFNILGYTAPEPAQDPTTIPYLGSDNYFSDPNSHGVTQAAIGIGKIDASEKRLDLIRSLEALAIEFPVITSPDSIVHDDVEVADGTVILDGATIVSGTVIGKACIVNTNSLPAAAPITPSSRTNSRMCSKLPAPPTRLLAHQRRLVQDSESTCHSPRRHRHAKCKSQPHCRGHLLHTPCRTANISAPLHDIFRHRRPGADDATSADRNGRDYDRPSSDQSRRPYPDATA